LDLEIGAILVAAGLPDSAEPHLLAAGTTPWLAVQAQYHLGTVAESRKDFTEARLYYQRVVRWWRDCDPELRSFTDRASRALARLDGDTGSGH